MSDGHAPGMIEKPKLFRPLNVKRLSMIIATLIRFIVKFVRDRRQSADAEDDTAASSRQARRV